MIHPHTELRLISPEIGYGPVATRFLPRGTIAWTLDCLDIIMSPAQVAALPPAYAEIFDRYSYVDPSGRSILCWDAGRYMNHHCEPAVRGVSPQFQILVRDVHPGEELTCEYAECNINFLECRCGSKRCRGRIRGEDLLEHGAAWEREVKDALALTSKVEQPLWRYVIDPELTKKYIDGRLAPTTMRGFYFDAAAERGEAGSAAR